MEAGSAEGSEEGAVLKAAGRDQVRRGEGGEALIQGLRKVMSQK